jgi:tetratricopeptide (TPR) repeat protein
MRAQLSQRKLITIETGSGEEIWSIHRTLQAKILQDLNRDAQKRERVYTQAFLLIRKRFPLPSPIQVPEPSKWPACRRYLPHVLSLRKILTGSILEITPSIKLAQLFSDGGIALWERGMTNEGLDLLKSAEAILDQLDCREDLLRANIHVVISLLIQDSGLAQLGECKSRISLALKTRKEYRDKTLPEFYTKNDDILLYNAESDYGCILLQYNKFQEAEPIFDSCFEKYRTWGPPEEIPYEYAKYYHHKAFCLMYQKKFNEAIKLAEQGLHWVTVATGRSAAHNRWKFDLACIVLQSGELKQAQNIHQEVLDSRIVQHGNSAFLTLQSWHAVGAIQAYLGDLANAE